MRTPADAGPEALVLTTDAGLALLAEVADVPRPAPADLARWRKRAEPELVAAALRIAEGRRKARGKFSRADRIWPEAVAVEQATAEPVARHKALRFARIPDAPVADLCCGIGGDAVALAATNAVVAVDLDPGMTRRTVWNAGVYGVGDRVQAECSRAETFPVAPASLVHIDPDRRVGSKGRAREVRDYVPSTDFLLGLAGRVRGGAIKLGPASDFETIGLGHELELVSLGGECKEATVWFGDLAEPGVGIRATHLPSGATWTDRDGPASAPRRTAPLDAWVFDPDPALSRSGLLDGYVASVGLARVGFGVDLLTGPGPVDSPWLAGFAVVESYPLDIKTLRRVVATRGLGPLEIKTKGVELLPEAVRRQLRPEGPNPATLILLGGRDIPSRAILAARPPA
ncbi:class I SAM-dependent methyltransferase [Tundrisphaera sp. TA3]|uniref:class I SAM-dependent methyltransferase n=1 Tax=Tundrisphaera sp. TA3 TaxID=3435775 RepID=UPI003EB6E47E